MQQALSQYLADVKHYLDVNDVAELLGVQPSTIYRYCKEGFLPHIRVGNNLRFDPRILAIWIQEHEFAARGSVTDKIADWVCEHVLDRTLNLRLPKQLSEVFATLSENWLAEALAEKIKDSPGGRYSQALQTFQAELNRQLTLAAQRDLLVELLWLTLYGS
jgi:excisionase family DNA binding protein